MSITLLSPFAGIPNSLLNQVTITPADVASGKKFIDASGNLQTGTATILNSGNIKVGYASFYMDRNGSTGTWTSTFTAPSTIICGASGWIYQDRFFDYGSQSRRVVREISASYSGNIGTAIYKKNEYTDPNEFKINVPFFYLE